MHIAEALLKRLSIGVLALGVLFAGGCGFGDVQFNGKIFDAIGLNDKNKNKSTPKLAERAPLVLPPSSQRLPEPGSRAAQAPDALASINDPDAAKQKSEEQLLAEHDAYCRQHYDPAVQRGDELAASIESPHGPCRKSILSGFKKLTGN